VPKRGEVDCFVPPLALWHPTTCLSMSRKGTGVWEKPDTQERDLIGEKYREVTWCPVAVVCRAAKELNRGQDVRDLETLRLVVTGHNQETQARRKMFPHPVTLKQNDQGRPIVVILLNIVSM